MDPSIPSQSFNIRHTTTKAVTLYPTKAQITRSIPNIALKPGPNTVVITGITPTCDEHSIKVDGTGSATITDLTIELVDNPEVYLEIYPDEDEDDDADLLDVSDDEPEKEGRLEEIKERIKRLEQHTKATTDEYTAQMTIKQACESYIRGERNYGQVVAEGCQPPSFDKILEIYAQQREKAVKEMSKGSDWIVDNNKEVKKLMKEEQRLTLEARRAQLKRDKDEQKRKMKEERKKLEEKKAKERVHQERVRFWPKKVYKVTVSLEAPDGFTPATSRRNSVTSVESVHKERSETPIGEATVNLTLNYITTSASWSPRYDLSLSTLTSTGQLDFSAELVNTTSESWKDTKITLSTSQSAYGGLTDAIPVLLPWHLRLIGPSRSFPTFSALMAPYEIAAAAKNDAPEKAKEKPRHQLFGLGAEYMALNQALKKQIQQQQQQQKTPSALAQRDMQNSIEALITRGENFSIQPAAARMSSGFGAAAATPQAFESAQVAQPFGAAAPSAMQSSGLFGGMFSGPSNAQAMPVSGGGSGGGLFGSSRAASNAQFASEAARSAPRVLARRRVTQDDEVERDDDAIEYLDEDERTVNEQMQALLVEESVFEESGLTTTYDLPGTKTLAPTSTKSKHKITRVEFRNIAYSHIIVPKLRAAAFLKARLKNLSKITLLKGDCGLTLDGTFLGHSSIPLCSKGEGFTLNLGIDPSVTVTYAKPTVRRGTTGSGLGVFGGAKERHEVFTRATTITNTKANATLDLTLLEQIPVSEDERLKINITYPRGLVVGGVKQAAGSAKEDPDAKDSHAGAWASATAVAKKGGEVTYSVRIQPGKGCRIALEYEVAYPIGEGVVSV